MSDAIERVARAIRAQQVGQLGDDSVPAWEEIDEETREDYRDDARAALAALAGTPSEQVIEDAAKALYATESRIPWALSANYARQDCRDAAKAVATLLTAHAEARVQRLEAALPLARLGLWVLEEQREWRADIDGGDVQDKAVAFGAIAPVTVTEPCDSGHCVCAEFDFPMECFRDTEATKQARALLPEETAK